MKELIIDGAEYNSIKEIHKLFAKKFDWPYYGHNLDALWDYLTTDVERPFTIRWINKAKSEENIGKDCIGMLKLLREVEERDKEHYPEGERFVLIVE